MLLTPTEANTYNNERFKKGNRKFPFLLFENLRVEME